MHSFVLGIMINVDVVVTVFKFRFKIILSNVIFRKSINKSI